jgi:hypothetical protein
MPIRQSRRDFLTALSAASVAGVLSARASLAEEGPPETTTIRIGKSTVVCVAPSYIADDLLRLEGFTDIRSVPAAGRRKGAARDEKRPEVGSSNRWRSNFLKGNTYPFRACISASQEELQTWRWSAIS